MAEDLEMAIDLLKRVDNLFPLESLLWIARSSQYRQRSTEIMHLLMDIRMFLEKRGVE